MSGGHGHGGGGGHAAPAKGHAAGAAHAAHGGGHGAGGHGGGHGAKGGGKKDPRGLLLLLVFAVFCVWFYRPQIGGLLQSSKKSEVSGGGQVSPPGSSQAQMPAASPSGSVEAKRGEEPEGSISRMAREANALLDKVLPAEGKNSEPPEGVISLRVGAAPVRRILRPGERSPWFKMTGGTGRVRIQCDGPGMQRPEAWSEPAETSRIWRFYNLDGAGVFSFYLVQE